jgi:hypothetical protein
LVIAQPAVVNVTSNVHVAPAASALPAQVSLVMENPVPPAKFIRRVSDVELSWLVMVKVVVVLL